MNRRRLLGLFAAAPLVPLMRKAPPLPDYVPEPVASAIAAPLTISARDVLAWEDQFFAEYVKESGFAQYFDGAHV